MDEREIRCAYAVLALSNFNGKDIGSLKIVDEFAKNELGLKKFDMIAAFASELSDRQMLLQGSFASVYGGLEGVPIGNQLVLLFNALGDLGQLMMSPNPGPFGDLALAALRFYHLDAGNPKIE